MDKHIFENQVRKRVANQAYVYFINLVHFLLELLPGPVRNLAFRVMLRKVGKHTFFDYKIYVKYPWLVELGEHVSVNRGVEFYPDYLGRHRIVVGSNVYVAPHVHFHASGHDLSDLSRHIGGQVTVGDGVWIGANTIVLPGVTIGRNSVIGAGSVVTKDIPANSVAVGNPARVIKARSEVQC